jgi:putative peptidoglycan lipid II flippase
MIEVDPNSNKKILKPTIQITFFFALSTLVNLITQLVVASFFGTGVARDCYFAACIIPIYIAILFNGSIGMILLTFLIKHRTNDSVEGVWIFTSRVLNIVMLALFCVCLVIDIFGDRIVALIFSGLTTDGMKLTTLLLRITMPLALFNVLNTLLTTIYQSEHRFLWPAITSFLGVVTTLCIVALLSNQIGIFALAIGVTVGAIVSPLLLIPELIREKKYKFRNGLWDIDVQLLLQSALPMFLAGLFFRANGLIERSLASGLTQGSLSYVGYASQIVTILVAMVTMGISSTLNPLMAHEYWENNYEALSKYFQKGLRFIFLLIIPIIAFFFSIGQNIIKIFLERGAFTPSATISVTMTLQGFVGTLLFTCLASIISRLLYIANKTTIAAAISLTEILLYLFLGLWLRSLFSYVGIALASSVSTGINILLACVVIVKYYPGCITKKFVLELGAIVFIGLIMYLCMIGCTQLLLARNVFVVTILTSMGGCCVYLFLIYKFLNIEELSRMYHRIFGYVRLKLFMIK